MSFRIHQVPTQLHTITSRIIFRHSTSERLKQNNKDQKEKYIYLQSLKIKLRGT